MLGLSCEAQALLLHGLWDIPRPGIELVSLHWQADSQPLGHQRSPTSSTLVEYWSCHYVVEMRPSEKNYSKGLKYHSLCTENYIPF